MMGQNTAAYLRRLELTFVVCPVSSRKKKLREKKKKKKPVRHKRRLSTMLSARRKAIGPRLSLTYNVSRGWLARDPGRLSCQLLSPLPRFPQSVIPLRGLASASVRRAEASHDGFTLGNLSWVPCRTKVAFLWEGMSRSFRGNHSARGVD